MKCPYCNKDMEQGVIQSSHVLNWRKKRRLVQRPGKHEGVVRLAPVSFWTGSYVEAWLCRDCSKVVIDYAAHYS